MPDETATTILHRLKRIRARAQGYFKKACSALSPGLSLNGFDRDCWAELPPRLKALSRSISTELGEVGRELAQALTLSPLVSKATQQNAGHDIRGMMAALRLRLYEHSDGWLQYDQDEFMGVVEARESAETPLDPKVGQATFETLAVRLQECIELVPSLHATPSKQTLIPERQAPVSDSTPLRKSPDVSSLLNKRTLTARETAEVLRFTKRYIYTLVKEEKLQCAEMTGKKRGALRIITSSVKKMMKARK
jgi:hypothetical protein